MTKSLFLHILIRKEKKNAMNGKSIFSERAREKPQTGCERLSREKREVRPGAGSLKGGHVGVR